MSKIHQGRVSAIFIAKTKGQPSIALKTVRAVEENGLDGCRHATRGRPGGRRQVLLIDAGSLSRLQLEPGQLKENFVVEGLDLTPLVPGQKLRLGSNVVVEVTMGCVPCKQLEAIRPGLMIDSWRQRGQLARVIAGGQVDVGDAVTLLDINPNAPAFHYPEPPEG